MRPLTPSEASMDQLVRDGYLNPTVVDKVAGDYPAPTENEIVVNDLIQAMERALLRMDAREPGRRTADVPVNLQDVRALRELLHDAYVARRLSGRRKSEKNLKVAR